MMRIAKGRKGMPRNLEEVLDALPSERRSRVEARAAELIAEELTLRELRKARHLTQVKMAKKLKMKQDAISRLENRTDMLISTLRKVVIGLGGDLTIVAEFPDRKPVRLTGIGEESLREPLSPTTGSH